jgi:large subunit ribosomal protein L6
LPDKVKVEIDGSKVKVTGPKGSLERELHPSMTAKQEDSTVLVERPSDSKLHRSLHGLTRQLIYNMVKGTSDGFERVLEINGVGYRAELRGKTLRLAVGFSHAIMVKPVEGIQFVLDDPTHVRVQGIDKELVGQVAAKIRGFRPPEPYKGKGIRYVGEYVRKKAGKTTA